VVCINNIEKIIAKQYSDLDDNEQKRYQRLYETCYEMKKIDVEKRADVVKQQAAQFREMMKGENERRMKEADEAKQELVRISKQILEDEEMAREARELGMTPPPAMYSKEEIDELRKKAEYKDISKGISDEKASECMAIYKKYKELNAIAEDLGQRSNFDPSLTDPAKSKAEEANDYLERYKAECRQEGGGAIEASM
jgi:hypothetical protein